MKPFKLTVFTEPISANGFIPRLKSFLRPLKFVLKGKKLPKKKKYGGHYAVTRSLVEGLQKIGADFNYNPVNENDIAENVIVLAGVETLRKGIVLKNKGKIKKLFAGPNVCELPSEENGLLNNKAIDICIVPSGWVGVSYLEEERGLQGRIEIWHAVVDTNYWQPSSKKRNTDVIVYWKTEEEEFCNAIENIMRNYNYNPIRIKYGSYKAKEYKEVLDRAVFAVFISRSESQGIALAEAWSMDVPTFVFDPREFFFHGRIVYNISSCPYLTRSTGLTWKNRDELKKIMSDKNSFIGFSPREHVLKQFTDEYSAGQLIKLLNN